MIRENNYNFDVEEYELFEMLDKMIKEKDAVECARVIDGLIRKLEQQA